MKRTQVGPCELAEAEFLPIRFRMMGGLVTVRVFDLARQRIATGEKFFKGRTLTVPDSLETVKIALLLAHEMNPYEDFSAEEEALMRGISSDTVRDRKKARELKSL